MIPAVSKERLNLSDALALLASKRPSRWSRRIRAWVAGAVWANLALWCAVIAQSARMDHQELALQIRLLIAVGLGATAALSILLVRVGRQAERASINASAMRQIIEMVQDVIWVIDAQGRMVFVNNAAQRIYGYAPSELHGELADAITAPENRDNDHACMSTLFDGGTITGHETVVVRRDGDRVPMLCNATALRDSKGEVIGAIGTAADITELKAMQENLLRTERAEVMGTMTSGVAHDFNNLLTVILGQTQHALAAEEEERARSRLLSIHEAAERARRMVARLLDFSERRETARTRIDLVAVVNRMESMLGSMLGEKAGLTLAMDAGSVNVSADWSQIEQVVMNLVLNAGDAIEEQGTVRVSVRGEELDDARATALGIDAGAWACIEVSDDGAGMAADSVARIFEPFFTTKSRGLGTGLGLASVQAIVRQHDGAIEVRSELGNGTSMRVFLPPATENEPATALST